jgi:hypothetical protein
VKVNRREDDEIDSWFSAIATFKGHVGKESAAAEHVIGKVLDQPRQRRVGKNVRVTISI